MHNWICYNICYLSHYLTNPLPVSLQHLCPPVVAIVLQWEAAVDVQVGRNEKLFLSSITAHLELW